MSDLDLSKMAPPRGSRQKKVRLGRGEASGVGKTAGRGGKGQKGRVGATIRRGFEGGQMPLYRRVPKFGFFSRKKCRGVNVYDLVHLDSLEKLDTNAVVTADVLYELGLAAKGNKIKVLSCGKLTKKITLKVHAISSSAKSQIEAAGGTVEIIEVRPAVSVK